MPRPRVVSFMSQWGKGPPAGDVPSSPRRSPPPALQANTCVDSPPTQQQRNRSNSRPSSRPVSMVQAYQPPLMEVAQDTLPELQPVFTYLNSHSNKLYQEGYFLKLHDLDTRGRPSPDRTWCEVFAQLVGTVLSVWDAQRLDDAGEDGQVVPSFVNLADASIKMIESLPMNGTGSQALSNVLSVSTAANNRYLFHFNSVHSFTQWTAGIRLAMFEHASLQEAYTGSLVAGKGRFLNNIRQIMEKTRFKYEDWCRVRFGAGTPWRRCWCVVTPPDDKEMRSSVKKQTIYHRAHPLLKGDVRFYETRKVYKKTRPIATITDAYSAYAIYPQSKPLIDQSTLVKIEGRVTIHSTPESSTEGFVFVMPEAHPAVSGFEIMLRFLFPVFDTFGIYGRPARLIADPLDTRSLMFAMPKKRRYGYLDILDVAGLIHADGSGDWSERQWRKQIKDLTSKRMTAVPRRRQRINHGNTVSRTSLPPSRSTSIRFNDDASSCTHSHPGTRDVSPAGREASRPTPPSNLNMSHKRSVSEIPRSSASEHLYDGAPTPPPHGMALGYDSSPDSDGASMHSGESPHDLPEIGAVSAAKPVPTPVHPPPNFSHTPSQRPRTRPFEAEQLRHAEAIDKDTLHEMAQANRSSITATVAAAGAAAAWKSSGNSRTSHGRAGVSKRSMEQSNRLPTIPASPYIPRDEPLSPTSATFAPAGPPVPEHRELPLGYYFPQQGDQRDPTSQSSESHAGPSVGRGIHRKPVPGRLTTPSPTGKSTPCRSPSNSSLCSFDDKMINPNEILDQLATQDGDDDAERARTMSSSLYDGESAGTPDYASIKSASTHQSRRSLERPRVGRLKTVGDIPAPSPPAPPPSPPLATPYEGWPAASGAKSHVPIIDFGPTYDLIRTDPKWMLRPGSSSSAVEGDGDQRPRSKHGLMTSDSPGAGAPRPGIAGGVLLDGFSRGSSPNALPTHRRTNSKSPHASDEHRARSGFWQPVPDRRSASPGYRVSLTPEQWVTQRASKSASPASAHARNKSTPNSPAPEGRITPTASRNPSGDWTQLLPHYQRTPPPRDRQGELSTRPNSRGASAMLNTASPAVAMGRRESSQLSAREQEHVARLTGTPLISMARSKMQTEAAQQSGLVGAIAARQQQKVDCKPVASNVVMQQAIAARQQQLRSMQAQRMAAGMPHMPVSIPIISSAGMGVPAPNMAFPMQPAFFPQQQPLCQEYATGMSMAPQQSYQQGFVPQPYGASWDQKQASKLARK